MSKNELCHKIQAARKLLVSQKAVDVGGLKKEPRSNVDGYAHGWNDCLDHLRKQGII